jgi:hypothetical protein
MTLGRSVNYRDGLLRNKNGYAFNDACFCDF